jgi:lipopolysaccharide biosynthesis glycosyltransferase
MYNILLACDSAYYDTWAINCTRSIQKFTPWINVHIVIVNPKNSYHKISGVNYYEDVIDFPNESCKIPYYQAVRFLKCAELFPNDEFVMTIDCDTLCTKEFTKEELHKIISTVHVQRHQKNIRWMAGLVTYGNNSKFRNEFKEKLLSIPLEEWKYGWDQDVLNELGATYNYSKLNVGEWMSFGRGGGIFLTLKGDQKFAKGYLEIYKEILKNV